MKRSVLPLCLLFIFLSKTTLFPQVSLMDSLALIDFFHSTKGENWSNSDNWLTGKPVKTWFGVVVENNRVTALQFGTGNNLHDSIPQSISQLTALKELNLNYNYINYIPEELGRLQNLQYLYVRSNQLTQLPASLINLTALKEIDVSANYIAKLPDSIGNLNKLRIMDFSYNELEAVPASIASLSVLFSINLSGNKFQSIPDIIFSLKSLKELYIGDNPIKDIPAQLSNLDSLSVFWLDGALVSSVPPELGLLTQMKELHLQGNLIKSLPAEIGKMISLNIMDVSYNLLTSLPQEIGNLKNLKSLSVVYNALRLLPESFGNLTSLKELMLRHNLLNSLPENFGELKNLSDLELEENAFTDSLPSQISKLQNLTLISFRSNFLRYCRSDVFLALTKLKWVFLENNLLENLPDFTKDTALTDLNVYSNRLTFEDIEPLVKIPNVRLYYSPQDSVLIKADTNMKPGAFITLHVNVGGKGNKYQWVKNGAVISNADSDFFNIEAADSLNAGAYICKVTNPVAPDLILYSQEYRLISGTAVTALASDKPGMPKEFAMEQNFPNPFNPVTTIKYQVSQESKVSIKVFSIDGREVKTLVDEMQTPGYKSIIWDGRDNNGKNVSSGIYLYKLQAGSFMFNRKMILLK